MYNVYLVFLVYFANVKDISYVLSVQIYKFQVLCHPSKNILKYFLYFISIRMVTFWYFKWLQFIMFYNENSNLKDMTWHVWFGPCFMLWLWKLLFFFFNKNSSPQFTWILSKLSSVVAFYHNFSFITIITFILVLTALPSFLWRHRWLSESIFFFWFIICS